MRENNNELRRTVKKNFRRETFVEAADNLRFNANVSASPIRDICRGRDTSANFERR